MEAPKDVVIVKANGERQIFDVDKLRGSLLNSGASEKATEDVVAHIVAELREGMTTHEIYQHAFSLLSRESKRVAKSYSLRRAVMELGPSGFPFEDFVAEILRAKGFESVTRQTVLGSCVPHEVDVVAYDDKKLIMVEAKFHNELGTKSDLKVVLYMNARFDDIGDNVYNYGGKDRKVTDSWLVTNTKFSSMAIHYGQCKDMTLIGWNYPREGNLQSMIEENQLHPITCLTSLSSEDKGKLLTSGIILCSHLKDKSEKLGSVIGKDSARKAIEEANELYANKK